MTTNRTPIGRPPKSRITPEAVALYVRCKKLAPIYFTHMRMDHCPGLDDGVHCPECREYLVASCALHSLLGRYPHQEFVECTIGDDEPPDWMAGDARNVADYHEAVEIRRQLEAAAEVQKAT